MVPFSGWYMPVQYTGIIEEHIHTRTAAGLFDICHMGEFILRGETAAGDLEKLMTRRIGDMPVGKCSYGFILNEAGGVIDDLIVFCLSRHEFLLVVNAGTTDKDRAWIEKNISAGTELRDVSAKTAKLDVQGPLSGDVVASLVGKGAVSGIKRYHFAWCKIGGMDTIVSRTGYTGELGFELFFQAERAPDIWDMLLKTGGVKPVGLGARDTLRLEMGYALYGNDIDEAHTPFEANLGRFVGMEKSFLGKDALLQQEDEGFKLLLAGFICEGRRSARKGFEVHVGEKKVGEVTSGAFSPCLKRGIGLCYIDKNLTGDGGEVLLTDGKTEIKATIKDIPVYKR